MTGPRIAISLTSIEHLTGGDISSVLDFARKADAAGVDQLTVSEHVAMGRDVSGYPYGAYPSTADADWYEPVAMLSAMAAVTQQARLSSSILIAPLRPAVLLAKQLATVDHLSNGRLEIGIGTGWQKAEYDGCGVPFEGRTALLEEQVRANMQVFNDALRMFSPFAAAQQAASKAAAEQTPAARDDDVTQLKRELDAMKARLDKLSK